MIVAQALLVIAAVSFLSGAALMLIGSYVRISRMANVGGFLFGFGIGLILIVAVIVAISTGGK